MSRFFLYKNSEVLGPYTINELSIIGIEQTDFVCDEIEEDWNEASDFSELELLFDEVEYFVAQNNDVYGPYELGDLATNGISAEASVYIERYGEWKDVTEQLRLITLSSTNIGQGQIGISTANPNFSIDHNGQIIRRSAPISQIESRNREVITEETKKRNWIKVVVITSLVLALLYFMSKC